MRRFFGIRTRGKGKEQNLERGEEGEAEAKEGVNGNDTLLGKPVGFSKVKAQTEDPPLDKLVPTGFRQQRSRGAPLERKSSPLSSEVSQGGPMAAKAHAEMRKQEAMAARRRRKVFMEVSEKCFLCSTNIKGAKTFEHLVPQWFIRAFNLHEDGVMMPFLGKKQRKFLDLGVPACEECNGGILGVVEQGMRAAIRPRAAKPLALVEPAILSAWMLKILYGLSWLQGRHDGASRDDHQEERLRQRLRHHAEAMNRQVGIMDRVTLGPKRRGAWKGVELYAWSDPSVLVMRLGSEVVMSYFPRSSEPMTRDASKLFKGLRQVKNEPDLVASLDEIVGSLAPNRTVLGLTSQRNRPTKLAEMVLVPDQEVLSIGRSEATALPNSSLAGSREL